MDTVKLAGEVGTLGFCLLEWKKFHRPRSVSPNWDETDRGASPRPRVNSWSSVGNRNPSPRRGSASIPWWDVGVWFLVGNRSISPTREWASVTWWRLGIRAGRPDGQNTRIPRYRCYGLSPYQTPTGQLRLSLNHTWVTCYHIRSSDGTDRTDSRSI